MQAGLFAGFLSAFLIELLGRLEQDPMDIIQDILIYQTQMMRNSSVGPYVPADFSPPEYIVVVNVLFYASLGVMLLAAFIAMLIKSWVREFDRGLRAMSIPEQRAKTREFRYPGMEYWKLPEMVAMLPLLIQISLLLFAIGLVIFLFYISKPSFGVTTAIFGVGFLYHAITTSISVFVTSSPFRSPLSRAMGMVHRHVHAYFCPRIAFFLLPSMGATPATALGRVRRRIEIFLQKSRPYLEKDFVEPITSTTVDEVQLFTAASALQRIHDSVPNSPHSSSLHWSVWQVAGSPAFRMPPSFNLPSWIFDRGNDEEYLSRLPPAKVVALVAALSRGRRTRDVIRIVTIKSFLQTGNTSKSPWAQLVVVVFHLLLEFWYPLDDVIRSESHDLTNRLQWNELRGEEALWFFNTLSELHSGGWVPREEHFFIGICLEMLSEQAPQWNYVYVPDIILLETVVTLVAIACSPDETYRQKALTNSRQHPWLLLNLRNPELISKMIDDAPHSCHKELISVLFLVLYGLMWRDSALLAAQSFVTITAKDDFPLYTSALTAVAPAIGHEGLSAIGRMLVAPQTQDLELIIYETIALEDHITHEDLLENYDHQLGASRNPDPNVLAVLLLLSKQLPLPRINELQNRNLKLTNPWLKLAARVIAQLDIPDESGMDIVLFYDHRVHNMVAALSLLRYVEGKVTLYTESHLLASFLESQELVISLLALEYYLRTIISYSDPSVPSYHLSGAIQTVFNLTLPGHQLQMGWVLLGVFVDEFESFSSEWQQAFADAFFTLSRRPLPRSWDEPETGAPASELEKILT